MEFLKDDPISLQFYFSEPKGDEYIIYAQPMWAQAYKPNEDFGLDVLKKWLNHYAEMDIKKGYLNVKSVSYNRVIYAFDINKWMRDNFLTSPNVKFHLPRTLEWKWKKNIPDMVLSRCSHINVGNCLANKFKEFLKTNQKSIFKEKMKIMKKVNYDWFEYQTDMQNGKFWVKLKTTILMGLTIAAYGASRVAKGLFEEENG